MIPQEENRLLISKHKLIKETYMVMTETLMIDTTATYSSIYIMPARSSIKEGIVIHTIAFSNIM